MVSSHQVFCGVHDDEQAWKGDRGARSEGGGGETRRGRSQDEFRARNALRRLVGVLVSFASCISIEAYINHPSCLHSLTFASAVVGRCMRSAVGTQGCAGAFLSAVRFKGTLSVLRNCRQLAMLFFVPANMEGLLVGLRIFMQISISRDVIVRKN